MIARLCLLAAVAALFLSGCHKAEDTLQTLQKDVAAYASSPTDASAAKIDENFARLDAQINDLREAGKSAEADGLSNRRDTLQAQYLAARMTASLLKAKEAAVGIGEAFRKAAEAIGKTLDAAPGQSR